MRRFFLAAMVFGIVWVAGFALAQADLSNPKGAMAEFAAAVEKGEMESAKGVVANEPGGQKILSHLIEVSVAARECDELMEKNFKESFSLQTSNWVVRKISALTQLTEVKIEGDKATFMEGVNARASLAKENGGWKVRLTSIFDQEGMGDSDIALAVYQAGVEGIKSGKCKSYDDVVGVMRVAKDKAETRALAKEPPLPAVDLSTPQSAVTEFKAAMENQQMSRVMETAILESGKRKLVENQIELNQKAKELRELARDKYGMEATMMLETTPHMDQASWRLEMNKARILVMGLDFAIQGDRATCSEKGKVVMTLRKTQKEWKVENPPIIPAEQVEKGTQVITEFIAGIKQLQEDVKAGKFKDADAFNDELAKQRMKRVGAQK